VPIIAMTREMGSLGSFVGIEVARQLGAEFLRDEPIRQVAREYRVRESRVVGAVEATPGLLERFRQRGRRYRIYLEAAVLEAALRERVVLMGRWSTLFLRGVPHAVRVRVCAPAEVRARRVMTRYGIDQAEAGRRIAAYDEGVRARMRQVFDVEWTDPILYDLVINTESVTVVAAARQVVTLASAPEFQPTPSGQQHLRDRALAARVRATLKAAPETGHLEVAVHATGETIELEGVVGSDSDRDGAIAVARVVPGVAAVSSALKVFRRPVR
jgi:cytidylate kinase